MNELKLYNAPTIMEQLINQVDEDWVLLPEAIQKLDELELAIEDKAKWIAIITKRLESYTDTIDNEIKRLQALKKSYNSNAEHLKNYLGYNLSKLDKKELETDLFKFSFRSSTSVEVDESLLEDKYKKEVIKLTPDKTLLKKELKEWKEIKGAKLVEKNNLQIR